MVGIICFESLRYLQRIYKYIPILQENDTDFEVVLWNRYNEEINVDFKTVVYNEELNSFQPVYKKIISFLRYRNFLKQVIKEKKYEKLIIVFSQTAFSLNRLLRKKYRNKFIYDYTDITYERFLLYKKTIKRLINSSYFTAITSEGFFNVLGKSEKFVISHNTRNFEVVDIKKVKSEKLRIVFFGMVRQLQFNCKICDIFANDDRFELIYHGAGYDKELLEYCTKNGYKNIKVTGAYKLENIETIVSNTDIVLNLYENDRIQKFATTVKFYDALRYKLPMIVNSGSYMANLVGEYDIGYIFDINNKNVLDDLYSYWSNLDFVSYSVGHTKVVEKIYDDDIKFKESLVDFLEC